MMIKDTNDVSNPHYNLDELMRELQDDVDDTTDSNNSNSNTQSDSIRQQSMDVNKVIKRARVAALMVVLVGAVASAGFLYMGISSAKGDQEDGFNRAASDYAKSIEVAWSDYNSATLFMHEATRKWRDENFTREDFRVLYHYLKSSGLEFFAAQYTPNVTNAERADLEAEANATFGHLEEFNYHGFKGQEPNPDNDGKLEMSPRSEQPFYFPIHFVEPRDNFKDIGHYDVYSAPWVKPAIDLALTDWIPTLSNPFRLAQHTEEHGFSTVLYHPGVPVPDSDITPRDVANMVIYIPHLMERAAESSSVSLDVYLYDSSAQDGTHNYMSAVEIDVDKDGKEVVLIPETPWEEVQDYSSSKLYYETEMMVANKLWTLVAVPKDGTFEADTTFVWISGLLVFAASILLAIWMIHNMRRSIQMHRVLSEAAAEASIVQNLFPANVRERILADAKKKTQASCPKAAKKVAFQNDGKDVNGKQMDMLSSECIFGSKPIAELHPYCTVMCADICGFTAWASVREPSQVFTLLEIVYHSWDNIAKRRRIFKVETVGDSYVAVAGLPHPRKDHAVAMARFATDCCKKMPRILEHLEKKLGPDTSKLGCRFGLHSGQCVAGVLRGDKGRFQLFGETPNLAATMEASGPRNMIQVSPETAELLQNAGHSNWLSPREDMVNVKGKGMLQTFFVHIKSESRSSVINDDTEGGTGDKLRGDRGKEERLIEWTVEVLSGILRSIVARRAALSKDTKPLPASVTGSPELQPLDEVAEIITLPACSASCLTKHVDPDSVRLDPEVLQQLTGLITEIASLYRNNSFHNFEHACHVTMSVIKMLGRIVDPKKVAAEAKLKGDDYDQTKLDADLHDHTFGITSDPLTQFAVAFSAVIHDVDHTGLTNMVLVKEANPLASKYKNKSVAEQNSVDLAWALFCKPKYAKFRACLCSDEDDFARFRQLVVNTVMATDIMDKELGAARKDRWNKAFSAEGSNSGELITESETDTVNRKATIVIEHLIQASDVAHTMQHWHVYAEWNEKLFHEMYQAYKDGHLDKDPSESWHKGEMGFFDFYIIPLAKKLFTCGVFGVSSDELLNYAIVNRKEWEMKGEEMVKNYLINHEKMICEKESQPKVAVAGVLPTTRDYEV